MEKVESLLSTFPILLLYFLTAGAVKKKISIPRSRCISAECDRTCGVRPVKSGSVGEWPSCDAMRV